MGEVIDQTAVDELIDETDVPPVPVLKRRASGAFVGEATIEKGIAQELAFPSFDSLPEFLRIGPWSPAAYLYLVGYGMWLVWSSRSAFESSPTSEANHLDWNAQLLSGVLAAYCTCINVYSLKTVGWWPFVSYTMIAYVLLNVRLFCNFVGVWQLAEILRFPVLVMAWITTCIWWFVLVPILLVFVPGGSEGRWKFVRFNFSLFLINVHLLNLPLAMLDHTSTWRPLVFFDLWIALATAFLYVLFYLNVLDRNGLHFYIILSPRPWWCIFTYTLILGIYCVAHAALG